LESLKKVIVCYNFYLTIHDFVEDGVSYFDSFSINHRKEFHYAWYRWFHNYQEKVKTIDNSFSFFVIKSKMKNFTKIKCFFMNC
jgi:hypothetical protein